ncbi:hypothetical protein MASR2M78_20970 [Treponema sp.]
MKQEDIIQAAFSVWGRETYRKMSLSDVATKLGVTKPALYRHFRNKEALLDAMRTDFFNRYSLCLKNIIQLASHPAPETERLLVVVTGLADYYARNRDDLIYAFVRIFGQADPDKLFIQELKARGILLEMLEGPHLKDPDTRAKSHFAIGTCFFGVAQFHMLHLAEQRLPTEAEIINLVENIRILVAEGFAFSRKDIESLDFAALEKIAKLTKEECKPGDDLLPAVASAVAEAGPWNASMELVARLSGLSKSGLYAHFKSKEDMLKRLFLSEFERIVALAEDRSSHSAIPLERLYLAMVAVTEYLRARPDVLVALDWVRVQRLELGTLIPEGLTELFSFLEVAPLHREKRIPELGLSVTIQWLLFLMVNMLMHSTHKNCNKDPQDGRLHNLYKCIVFGLRGW